MKLSLVFPAWCEIFGPYKKVAKKASSFPPLNLCIIAAIAERQGWQIQIVDAEVEELSIQNVLKRISDFGPDLIGLSSTTPFFHVTESLARLIKTEIDVPIVAGGVHISIKQEEAFSEYFDYIFVGECESNLGLFLQRFENKESISDIPGIMSRSGENIIYTGEAAKIENLDNVPFPARHLLQCDKYFVGTLQGRKNYTSVQMSRGCPFNCVFCANELFGKKVRRRSIENVLEELDLIVNKMDIRHIYFLDDTLTLDRDFILQLCDEIQRRDFRFTFEGGTRANLWDEELATRLKQCGLIRISFGLETADPVVRKIIRKQVPLESYIESNRLNNKLGIETINSVMIGLPGETRESIEHTVNFLCKAKDIQHATYGIAIPYPGTELLQMAQQGKHGLQLLENDFSKYQRYGSSVMRVGDIEPHEMIMLQQKGLRRIYSCYWRVLPAIKRHGFKALIGPALDSAKGMVGGFIFNNK